MHRANERQVEIPIGENSINLEIEQQIIEIQPPSLPHSRNRSLALEIEIIENLSEIGIDRSESSQTLEIGNRSRRTISIIDSAGPESASQGPSIILSQSSIRSVEQPQRVEQVNKKFDVTVTNFYEIVPLVELDSMGRYNGEIYCNVCKNELANGNECRVLPCNHIFHGECIYGWVIEKQNKKCPTDGYEFSESKIQ
jgi:hypothetical protein